MNPCICRALGPLPPESILARRIEEEHAMSVVRLRIARGGKFQGRGTGFIVVSTPTRLVIMTCGHSFNNWAENTAVAVTFHDKREASAEVVWVKRQREVALLLIVDSP